MNNNTNLTPIKDVYGWTYCGDLAEVRCRVRAGWVLNAVDAVHRAQRDPLRFVQETETPHLGFTSTGKRYWSW